MQKRKKREEERAVREGAGEREREREHAELAERVPGDAYHSYLDKCIKTTLHFLSPPLLPSSPLFGNIELTVRLAP